MKTLLALILMAPAFAGQSLQLTTQTASAAVAAYPVGQSYTVDFVLHDYDLTIANGTHICDAPALGLNCYIINTSGQYFIQMFDSNDVGLSGLCHFTDLLSGTALRRLRFIHDSVNKVDTCLTWDINFVLQDKESYTFTSETGTNSPGLTLAGGGSAKPISWAYYRIYNTALPLTAPPPYTSQAATGTLGYWKFDLANNTGSLNDSSGHGNAMVLSSGSPTYVSQAGQTVVIPVLHATLAANVPPSEIPGYGIPSWSPGITNQLDGSQSVSDSDAPVITHLWSQSSGPSTLSLSSTTSATPTVTNVLSTIFATADYLVSDLVTDTSNSQSATASLHIGAVPQDAYHIVQTGLPALDLAFGPQMAYGYVQEGFVDYWELHASLLRATDYAAPVTTQGITYCGWASSGCGNKPQWETAGPGTVSYYFNGKCPTVSPCNSNGGTTLAATCSNTAMSCTVANGAAIDTSSLPTRIILYDGTNNDELRVASVSGNTVNFAYDPAMYPRHTFVSGNYVLQAKNSGTGTHFLTDANYAVCPLGANTLPGLSSYSTGTVALTAGSTTVTLSGGTWAIPTMQVGDFIQVAATTSGNPFLFKAQIVSFTSTTATLARPFPADADTASGLAYKIMPATRTAILHYASQYSDPTFDPSADAIQGVGTTGCESETDFYSNPVNLAPNSFASGIDIAAVNGSHQVGMQYSITDTTGWINSSGTGGINFYCEVCAHYLLHVSSGLTAPLTSARTVADYWAHSWQQQFGFSPLFIGGGALGEIVAKQIDPSSHVSWSSLRQFGNLGVRWINGVAANGCNGWDDVRDTSYYYRQAIDMAFYDPDTTSTSAPGGIPWRTYWRNQLAQMEANDAACENQGLPAVSQNGFATGAYFNGNPAATGFPALTLTNGSATATGTAIPTSLCYGTATGTATLINGSNSVSVLTGTIPMGTTNLFLTGTTGGGATVRIQSLAYGGGVVGGNWTGDSGTVNWMSSAIDGSPADGTAGDALTIATDANDLTNLQKNWECIWNSSTQVTLNRNWDGSTGSSYHPYRANVVGFATQPFMTGGLKTAQESDLANQTDPAFSALSAQYKGFEARTTAWLWNIGMDPQLLATNYARTEQECEPTNTVPAGTTFVWRAPGCSWGGDPVSITLAREQNAETATGLALYYSLNPTPTNKTQADKYYGAMWGSVVYGGAYQDQYSVANNLGVSNMSDTYIHTGKWLGFFCGMGNCRRWPAQRVTTVEGPPAVMRGGGVMRSH